MLMASLSVLLAALAAPHALSVEYRTDPVGLDTPSPRLAWKLGAGTDAQSAYELEIDGASLGRRAGDVPACAEWPGAPLASSQRVTWRVRTWDRAGRASDWSAPATFTTGVMRPADWRAKWIATDPSTRADEDFGAAEWITGAPDTNGVVRFEYDFDCPELKPGEFVEMVHAGVTKHTIVVNGKTFQKPTGMLHDWRYVRFRDMSPWLKPGRNHVVVEVTPAAPVRPGEPFDHIRVRAPEGTCAFIAKIILPGGKTLVTDRRWKGARPLGRVRETDFGKQLFLRHETVSPAFAKRFRIEKPVASAVLHVTGVGFYEASLDGVKIGDKVLDPAPTAYDRRVLYSTYRLDDALAVGEHELKILVGHGWYDQRAIATWNFESAPWRDAPRAIAQLEIAYADGSRAEVVTDRTWRQVKSPVGYDDNFEGEVSGAVDTGWIDPEARGLVAAEVPGPAGVLVAEAQPGAKVMRTFPAKAVWACGERAYIIDAGVNLSGWIRLDLAGQRAGDVISLRYDERVNGKGPALPSSRDGRNRFVFTTGPREKSAAGEPRNIDHHFSYTGSQRVCPVDAEFQCDRVVVGDDGRVRYEPRFVYHGFRYVYVRGLARAPKPEEVTVCFVHTAFDTVGSFACSDPTFNTLMEMADRAYRSNFADGVPTDCPHREKNGWTGDANIACELAQYCYENTAGYEKYVRDIFDSQLDNGNIACILPSSGWGYHWGNGPGWDACLTVIPWTLYAYRGDRRILDACYPALCRYLAYTATKADADGLVQHGLGDWVPVAREHMPDTGYTVSCYYYQAQRIAAEIARLKGMPVETAMWERRAAKTLGGLNRRFYRGNGVYDNGGQTAQGMAIAFGIAPAAEEKAVAARLVDAFEKTGCHVDMGLYGTKHCFRALSRIGRTDLAWKTLVNPTKPSMVEWIQKGGTTLWEDWADGASRNHIMFGDFAGWAYQYLAGIRLEEAPGSTSALPLPTATGFRRLVIEPQFLKELDHLSASVDTPCGVTAVAWRRTGGKIALSVTVPPGATATLKLPGRADRALAAGTAEIDL